MNNHFTRIGDRLWAPIAVLAMIIPVQVLAGVTDLANEPLTSGGSSSVVKPNIAFVVDDSGSMTFESMPADDDIFDKYGWNVTHERDNRCFGWHKHNTLFYNPAVTYKPPFKLDGAVYSDGVKRYPDAEFTAALKDGYFANGSNTFNSSIVNAPTNLSQLSNLSPNPVSCNIPTSAKATINITTDGAFNGGGCYRVTRITVDTGSGSINLLKYAVPELATQCYTNQDSFGTAIEKSIDDNTGVTSFSASYNSDTNKLTITAPVSLGNITVTPTHDIYKVSGGGSENFDRSAFSGGTDPGFVECASSPTRYYYSTHKTDPTSSSCEDDSDYSIITSENQIAAPGVLTGSAAAKTNYANWYTYYRSRAALMKAAAGEAFKDLDESKYRVGLFFLNSEEATGDNNKNNDLKITDFTGSASGTQRYSWFDRLYKHKEGGGTPLRGALSRMGRMYAGKISGWDPVQYSCQQNFTILSTDGYWNDGDNATYGPKRENGRINVGNMDGGGTVNAVGATARITISNYRDNDSGDCYKVTSVRVGSTELMNAATACLGTKDSLGTAIASQIEARKTVTGYSAASSNGVVTITAPAGAGNLGVAPAITTEQTGDGVRDFTVENFSSFSAAYNGFPPPFKDGLNKSNTLADVAHYYYLTDLRVPNNCTNTIEGTTYNNLCENNVKGSGDDVQSQQHMTTYTIGLGVSGSITYQSDYKTASDITGKNTYYDILNNGLNWPDPTTAEAHKIDDLWHAAVNGRGIYYSASEASSLRKGIQSALEGIQSQKGSASAAATSNLEPVAGDNFVYLALYQTVDWYGDLQSYTIDPNAGTLSTTPGWSAKDRLDAIVTAAGADADGRTIKFFNSNATATNKLKEFNLTNITADGLAGNFANICSKTPAIDQCGNSADDLTNDQKTIANSAANLIAYLRGQDKYEDETSNPIPASGTNPRIYRGRRHILGDIVNAVPVYMKKPPFSYGMFDNSYNEFKTANENRAATVFIASNDGMMHAIDATNGNERWAYVPTFSMSNMWTLADRNYANNHRYFVDGSPTLADVCKTPSADNPEVCSDDSEWKTIVVGGLNKGGCGYYALDVTDPTNPKGLWEFTHPNLGYAYGNPLVVRNKQGKWVVIFSSGYNNYPSNGCGSNGDGNGHVFVLDAITGLPVDPDQVTIPTYTSGTTPAGTVSNPSGLGRLNAWVDNIARPVADRVYGGDLKGNVWRIDFDNNHGTAGKEATLLAQLKDGSNNSQPITVKPSLGEVRQGSTAYPVVFVGTGRFLGVTDKSDTSQQTVYALKDSFATISNVRGSTMKSRTLTETTGSADKAYAGRIIRTVSGTTVNWIDDDGWYMDLNPNNLSPGERVNVDMSLQYNMLSVAANVPNENACTAGGYGFLYFLDIATGKNIVGSVDSMAGVRLPGNALVAGFKTVKLTSGKTVTLCTDSSGNLCVEQTPDAGGGGGSTVKRTTWREIVD